MIAPKTIREFVEKMGDEDRSWVEHCGRALSGEVSFVNKISGERQHHRDVTWQTRH